MLPKTIEATVKFIEEEDCATRDISLLNGSGVWVFLTMKYRSQSRKDFFKDAATSLPESPWQKVANSLV